MNLSEAASRLIRPNYRNGERAHVSFARWGMFIIRATDTFPEREHDPSAASSQPLAAEWPRFCAALQKTNEFYCVKGLHV